ncbi:MAG: hypothetical protein M3P45_13925 [Acidobacteriota bacterium]|nr:hypothetical protein [Acidobacteriota bacterium]
MAKIEEAFKTKLGALPVGLTKPPIIAAGMAAIKSLVDSQKTVPGIGEKTKASS